MNSLKALSPTQRFSFSFPYFVSSENLRSVELCHVFFLSPFSIFTYKNENLNFSSCFFSVLRFFFTIFFSQTSAFIIWILLCFLCGKRQAVSELGWVCRWMYALRACLDTIKLNNGSAIKNNVHLPTREKKEEKERKEMSRSNFTIVSFAPFLFRSFYLSLYCWIWVRKNQQRLKSKLLIHVMSSYELSLFAWQNGIGEKEENEDGKKIRKAHFDSSFFSFPPFSILSTREKK